MALRKSFAATDNFNLEVNLENCYCKVFELKGDKTSLNIVVYVFNDDATKFLMEKRYVFRQIWVVKTLLLKPTTI